jgi:hypothetical protein
MNLIPVKITIYNPDDCTVKDQQELLDKRIMRISNETYVQGALLTQADIAIILGESTKTISRHITALEKKGELVPTRGKWKEIGPGVSHKKKILELYLKGYVRQEVVSEITVQPVLFPLGVSLLQHAFLVTGGCEACKTTWRRIRTLIYLIC